MSEPRTPGSDQQALRSKGRPRSNDTAGPTTLQSVERAFAFLDVVAASPVPPRVREVAQKLDLNVTTAYHLLNTLTQVGYITKDEGGQLRIGARAAGLYHAMIRQFNPARDLEHVVHELSRQTGETTYLTQLTGQGVVVQLLAESTHSVRVAGLSAGYFGREHQRASGRVVLAFADEATRDRILAAAMASETATRRKKERKRLEGILREIQGNGWAVDDEEYEADVCCVAAPYFGHDGRVAGSLAVSLPAQRFGESRDALIASVVEASSLLSEISGSGRPAAARGSAP